MHEVELVRRVWNRLQEGYDYTSEPNYRAPSQATIERVVQTTLRILGIPIRPDGSVVIDIVTPIVEASPPIGTARRLSRTGYTIVRCLTALEGKLWGVLTAAFVMSLRPSEVEVLDADMPEKTDAILWRVRVRLTKAGLIQYIEQEVEVDLPEGIDNGYALVQAANRPAPFHALMCHACCVRPADREAVERRVTWSRMCQPCIDRIYPEPSLTRGCYYEPDGKALR